VALRTRMGSIACGWIIQNSASRQASPSSPRYTSTHIRLKPMNTTSGSNSRRRNNRAIRNMGIKYYRKSIRVATECRSLKSDGWNCFFESSSEKSRLPRSCEGAKCDLHSE
jgi:hypothetical protein